MCQQFARRLSLRWFKASEKWVFIVLKICHWFGLVVRLRGLGASLRLLFVRSCICYLRRLISRQRFILGLCFRFQLMTQMSLMWFKAWVMLLKWPMKLTRVVWTLTLWSCYLTAQQLLWMRTLLLKKQWWWVYNTATFSCFHSSWITIYKSVMGVN